MLHAAGWQEGGLSLGYEKLILDADQLGAMEVWARGVDVSDNGQAMEAFRTNAHGDHFLGNPHTLANFESAFWRSDISDAASYEQWAEEGLALGGPASQRPLEAVVGRLRAAPHRRRCRCRTARLYGATQGPRCPTRSADRKGRSAGCRQVDQMGPGGKAKAY